jgi:hypothetical protein
VTANGDATTKRLGRGLVVQDEADADGKAFYGLIFRREVRTVRSDEVE